jgi:putative membrane protein
MVMLRLSESEHAAVSAAVAKAEQLSDGEIVTIIAPKSDSYHDVGLHYSVLAMLLVPAALAMVPQGLIDRGLALLLGWNAELARGMLMMLLFALLAFIFLIVRFALAWMPLRMMLTPARTKNRRVRRRAIELFRVSADQRTSGRTGVLLYLSLLEHRVELIADQAIHGRVEPEVWGDAMAILIENVKGGRPGQGMTLAVEKIGAILAEHLPPTGGNPNELPDRLIEL